MFIYILSTINVYHIYYTVSFTNIIFTRYVVYILSTLSVISNTTKTNNKAYQIYNTIFENISSDTDKTITIHPILFDKLKNHTNKSNIYLKKRIVEGCIYTAYNMYKIYHYKIKQNKNHKKSGA